MTSTAEPEVPAPGRTEDEVDPKVVERTSDIHGRGLFAARDLNAAEKLIEYRGEVIGWDEAIERYDRRTADESADRSVTYYFDRGDGTVIDGDRGGNSARFINHGCEPNCEAIAHGQRIWIHSLRTIAAGEEILLDYALELDDADDPDLRRLYACRCGAASCRATMLAP